MDIVVVTFISYSSIKMYILMLVWTGNDPHLLPPKLRNYKHFKKFKTVTPQSPLGNPVVSFRGLITEIF